MTTRRDFFKQTVGTLTAAMLFKDGLKQGQTGWHPDVVTMDDYQHEVGDIFHVPRTKEQFIITQMEDGRLQFSRPIQNEVLPDDEVILLGNIGVEGASGKSGWLDEGTRKELFPGPWRRFFRRLVRG